MELVFQLERRLPNCQGTNSVPSAEIFVKLVHKLHPPPTLLPQRKHALFV